MAVAIENALDDGLDFHITPDGQGRKAIRKVVIDEFPDDPETGLPSKSFVLNAGHFDLPFIEDVEIEGDGATWNPDSATVLVDKPGEWKMTALGPPEFKNKNRD